MNRAFPSRHGGSLKVTLKVLKDKEKYEDRERRGMLIKACQQRDDKKEMLRKAC